MSKNNNPGLSSLLNLARDTNATGFQGFGLLSGIKPKPSLLNTGLFGASSKRKIFVSYHHENDQEYKNQLVRFLEDSYQVIDRSLTDPMDSDDTEYVMRRIRERYIKGSSVTIVLCGAETSKRKFVDWEIKATLDAGHGLVGVWLDSAPRGLLGSVLVPDRLHDNISSKYAAWVHWNAFVSSPLAARGHIEDSIVRSKNLIVNNRSMKSRNG